MIAETSESMKLPAGTPIRRFYRCGDCLSTYAVEPIRHDRRIVPGRRHVNWGTGERWQGADRVTATAVWGDRPECGCGGSLEHMGDTLYGHGRRGLYRLEEQSVCDARCTSAHGPCCSCQCGGLNHGSNATITVAIAMGSKPRGEPTAAASKRADRWRATLAEIRSALRDAYGAVEDARADGRYLPRDQFDRWRDAQGMRRELDRIRKLRTDKGRSSAAAELLSEIRKAGNCPTLEPPAEEKEPPGKHTGEVGKRSTWRARFDASPSWESAYGITWCNLLTISDGPDAGSRLVWMTRESIGFDSQGDFSKGFEVSITGTVKRHDMRDGKPQTILTRCKVERIGEE